MVVVVVVVLFVAVAMLVVMFFLVMLVMVTLPIRSPTRFAVIDIGIAPLMPEATRARRDGQHRRQKT